MMDLRVERQGLVIAGFAFIWMAIQRNTLYERKIKYIIV